MEHNFHLSFGGKNARVVLVPPPPAPPRVRRVSPRRMEVQSLKVENGFRPLAPTVETLKALCEGDPEIDFDRIGQIVEATTRAYYEPSTRQVARQFQLYTVALSPEGRETDRKPFQPRSANVNDDAAPIQVTKLVPLEKFCESFVVVRAYQLCHDDGLTYEFLHGLARELETKKVVGLLGGGTKGAAPLVFGRNGRPYRCALAGRTEGDRYLLTVMLLGQELKIPVSRSAKEEA